MQGFPTWCAMSNSIQRASSTGNGGFSGNFNGNRDIARLRMRIRKCRLSHATLKIRRDIIGKRRSKRNIWSCWKSLAWHTISDTFLIRARITCRKRDARAAPHSKRVCMSIEMRLFRSIRAIDIKVLTDLGISLFRSCYRHLGLYRPKRGLSHIARNRCAPAMATSSIRMRLFRSERTCMSIETADTMKS